MNVSDCDDDDGDIWDYIPLKRKKKVVRTSTSIQNLPIIIKQRPRNKSQSATNDESSSSSCTDVIGRKESGQNEAVEHIFPSFSQQKTSSYLHHGPPSSSSTSNKIKEKNKAETKSKTKRYHHRKISTKESSGLMEKTPINTESTKYNLSESLPSCPFCQMTFAIFLNNNNNNNSQINIPLWFNHISSCSDTFPKNLKECPHGVNCAVQEKEHYRNFQHHSLAQLRAILSPDSGKTSFPGDIQFKTAEEFIRDNNNAGRLGSLPIPQDASVKRGTVSEISSSCNESPLQSFRVESDCKNTDIDTFKRLFSTDSIKTPKKNTAKSPAKSTPKKKTPLLKDLSQQTLMYDSNKKKLVLTPNKSPSSRPLLSPVHTPKKQVSSSPLQKSKPLLSPFHTPKKQESSSTWESLSVRKPNPPENNSSLLYSLKEIDSQSQSSVSSPSLQKNKSPCPFAVNGNSDSVPPAPMIMSSKIEQSSSSSPSNSQGKDKSGKSYVTALFLSDSEDDGDSKTEKADPKSTGNISDSSGDSSATEPAINLDFSFPNSNTLSSQSSLAEDSIEKAARSLTPNTHRRTHSQTVGSSELNSEYSLSDDDDDELVSSDISGATQSEKPSKNTAELKTNLVNVLSSKSNQSLPVLKSKTHSPSSTMRFHALNLTSPSKPTNTRKRPSLKTNCANAVSNQMQLTSFFIRKTHDNQSPTAPNVESDKTIETNAGPVVLPKNTDQKKPLSDIEKSPKPVMELEQFKNMFNKKPPAKKLLPVPVPELQIEPMTQPSSSPVKRHQKQLPSCPFYKKIPDTALTVDAFKYGSIPGCRAYILTHFHYDHYQGLTKHFKHPIYCSQVTANLVKLKIGVSPQYLHPLPLYCPVIVEGVDVTLLDANHCPGATLFLLKTKDGKVILHTGDFRADSVMEEYAALKNLKIHQLYLDTTYCNSSHAFPSQEEVLELSVSLSISALQENPKTLIVVGSYTIGKEKVFLAIAEAIKSKIGVTKEKKTILDCQENSSLNKLVSLNMNECKVHVVKMNSLNYKALSEHLARYKNKFDRILAFRPTGWTHSDKNESLSNIKPSLKRDNITLYGLPYSEHSSFTEMKRFVQFAQPENIIPTVNNGSPSARKAMEDIFKSWLSEKPIPINKFFALSQGN